MSLMTIAPTRPAPTSSIIAKNPGAVKTGAWDTIIGKVRRVGQPIPGGMIFSFLIAVPPETKML